MTHTHFEVLSQAEVETIHAASMEILETVGVKVEYKKARELFRQAGAVLDDNQQSVRIPEKLIQWAVDQAPKQFTLYGADPNFRLELGGDRVYFAGLGTPTHMLDMDTGLRRPAVLADVIRHIQLIEACENISSSQVDVWPNDIPMTTIHTESIRAWVKNTRKPFGMGCYGYLPTVDMMRLMAITLGGKEELRQRPRFFAICSTVSPLQMTQTQVEGMLICADYGQPITMSPEAIAGATAPVTLAGLLTQENANVLAHLTLAQIFRPGTPVLYGSVSTIANMRLGTVALGAFETGLITAGAAQMARYYHIPSRGVGGTTDSKREDLQAGAERTATLLQSVLAGVHFITCVGTLDSTMLESDPLLVIDDELCGAALRVARGIEVNPETLALDAIRRVGFSGNYFAEKHTQKYLRGEHFIPRLLPREPYESWEKSGGKTALQLAKERTCQILADHQPRLLDPAMEREMDDYCAMVSARTIEDFYSYEAEEKQDLENL